jgi:hypothetical protein
MDVMWQAIGSIVAVALAPLLRAGVSASRRNRFANRARALHQLADEIEVHDPSGAMALRALAAERVLRVAGLEQQALRRRFDPAWPFAFLVFMLPAGLASFFAWTYRGWWTWPVLVTSVLWAVIVTAAGSSQVWKEYETAAHGAGEAGHEGLSDSDRRG